MLRVRVLVLALLVACGSSPPAGTFDRPSSTVLFPRTDAVLRVRIADADGERRRGLMEVEHLPDDQGMAFVFAEPSTSSFWMKNTLIPLTIAFVDDDGRVVGFRDMQPCETDSCPLYGTTEPFVFAIEANLGWFDEHGIEVGDPAELRAAHDG